jgi:hypothetical protein
VTASLSGTNPALADPATLGNGIVRWLPVFCCRRAWRWISARAWMSPLVFSGSTASPFLSAVTAPYTALANGGRYTGITLVPADNLRIRLGASFNDERLDRFPIRRQRAHRALGDDL